MIFIVRLHLFATRLLAEENRSSLEALAIPSILLVNYNTRVIALFGPFGGTKVLWIRCVTSDGNGSKYV